MNYPLPVLRSAWRRIAKPSRAVARDLKHGESGALMSPARYGIKSNALKPPPASYPRPPLRALSARLDSIIEFRSPIHIKKENEGKFTATKKKTGKSTAELKHSKNPLTRKRAVFAENAKKWNHKKKMSDPSSHIEFARGQRSAGLFAKVANFAPGRHAYWRAVENRGGEDAKAVAQATMATRNLIKWHKSGMLPVRLARGGVDESRFPMRKFNARLDHILEFSGGYVNTGIGVRKEKGVGGHFNRNAAKYISVPFVAPTFGASLGIGALVDHLRKKKSVLKTKSENVVGPELAKGKVYNGLSARLDRIIQMDSRPRDPMGQFVNQDETGPNPNDMAKVYQGANRTGIVEGAGATVAGVAAGPLVKALMSKVKRK